MSYRGSGPIGLPVVATYLLVRRTPLSRWLFGGAEEGSPVTHAYHYCAL